MRRSQLYFSISGKKHTKQPLKKKSFLLCSPLPPPTTPQRPSPSLPQRGFFLLALFLSPRSAINISACVGPTECLLLTAASFVSVTQRTNRHHAAQQLPVRQRPATMQLSGCLTLAEWEDLSQVPGRNGPTIHHKWATGAVTLRDTLLYAFDQREKVSNYCITATKYAKLRLSLLLVISYLV